jgi:hypothetical protein
VLLAHSNLEFASQTANFLVDSPFAKVDVSFQATVWSPAVGSKLCEPLRRRRRRRRILLIKGKQGVQ